MSFRDREKQRYEKIKPKLFSVAAQVPGIYRGKPRPFCLADGHSAENLHESIRKEVIEYFAQRKIPWHDGTSSKDDTQKNLPSNHLCCSQTMCVNFLFPMVRDKELSRDVFKMFFENLSEILPFDADKPLSDRTKPFLAFEWIGMRNYLGETNWKTRGANCTSADFAFRFRTTDDKIQLVLGEWKYTEEYKGRKLPPHEDINPTQYRVYKNAFDNWKKNNSKLPPYESFFVEPFYQFMRQTLLAREMEKAKMTKPPGEMDADIVSLLHISPAANEDFGKTFTSPIFKIYGDTVTKAWTSIVTKDRFRALSTEKFLQTIKFTAKTKYQIWLKWIEERYG